MAGSSSIEQMPPGMTTTERRGLQLTIVLASLVFWSGALDSHAAMKTAVIAVGVISVLGLAAYDVVTRGALSARIGPASATLLCFVLAAVIATVSSEDHWRSFIGQRGRGTGLM